MAYLFMILGPSTASTLILEENSTLTELIGFTSMKGVICPHIFFINFTFEAFLVLQLL